MAKALARLARQLRPSDRFTYRVQGDTVELLVLRLATTGTGAGTRFLRQVCDVLDEHRYAASAVVDPTDSLLDPDQATLLRSYRRFGFSVVGEDPDGQPVIRRECAQPVDRAVEPGVAQWVQGQSTRRQERDAIHG